GGKARTIRPGDLVWCPPGEKHWHGAAPATAMTHVAVVERLGGRAVDWLEQVSDADYESAARSAE
ncbi:MAG TPA: cupin domain-containing protein, partial [Thermoanaerobaculia bacterium]|nr:cupin domain-containing protein [Thermoanaerobaculia bacterium]